MHATIYLITTQYVSAARFADLARALEAATTGLSRTIRMEAEGEGLWAALDDMAASGASEITLRPVGLPVSQSLLAWLPGAAGSWLSRQDTPPRVAIASSMQYDAAVIQAIASPPSHATPVEPTPDGNLGKGWDNPPPMQHHLLVCAGPRCHLRDAPSLIDHLKREIARAGLSDACLITTTGCLYPCNQGPSLVHYPHGHWYRIYDAAAVQRFVSEALVAGRPLHDMIFHKTGETHEHV